MKRCIFLLIPAVLILQGLTGQSQYTPLRKLEESLIFPLQPKHSHACSFIELPNGDMLAAWYYGSGERNSDDVRILGARLKKGSKNWSDSFLLADTPGLPDCNPVLFLNKEGKLFLVWIAIEANMWEYAILRFRTSVDYLGNGSPIWNWQDNILLKPDDHFAEEVASRIREIEGRESSLTESQKRADSMLIQASRNPGFRSIGWMTRIQPLRLNNGRILLPLYSDRYSLSLIAISDDDGTTWHAGLPIVGRGNVQPALVQNKNGHIVAYMRDNGSQPSRVQVSESGDNGETWTAASKTDIPNTASVELKVLQDGRWAFVGNDIDDGRYQFSLYLSDDEGKTWKWKKPIESVPKGNGSFSYPCLLQTRDGLLHISYSYSIDKKGESIKYIVVDLGSLNK
jgi:predicted neuraminidase